MVGLGATAAAAALEQPAARVRFKEDAGGSGSTESSPSKGLLPPKTPAPTAVDAPQLAGEQSPPSGLTHALRQSASVPALVGAAGASGQQRMQHPWGSSPGLLQQAGSIEGGSAEDGMLLFTAPMAAAGGLDPQLLVHSPESSTDGVASPGVAAAAAHVVAAAATGADAGSPASRSQQQQQQSLAAVAVPAAAVAAEGEEEGGVTPRPSAAAALDITSPSTEGYSLADLLQVSCRGCHLAGRAVCMWQLQPACWQSACRDSRHGQGWEGLLPGPPDPPACRPPCCAVQGPAPPLARSPGSRSTSFLGDLSQLSHLDDGALSPRRSLPLPGCSPLPPGMAGLRDPPHLPGMPPLSMLLPRLPLLPAPPAAFRGGAPPPSCPLPAGLMQQQWRPLGAPSRPGMAAGSKPLGQPLMRPGMGRPLRAPLGTPGLARPHGNQLMLGGPTLMVPVPATAHLEDGEALLCPAGMLLAGCGCCGILCLLAGRLLE